MARPRKPSADDPLPPTKQLVVQARCNGVVVADVVFEVDGLTIAGVYSCYPIANVSGAQREEATQSVITANTKLYPPTDYETVYSALWGARK